MEPTTTETYRVMAPPDADGEESGDADGWLLLDVETAASRRVPRGAAGVAAGVGGEARDRLAATLRDLEPGNRVRATLAGGERETAGGDTEVAGPGVAEAEVADLTVETRTLVRFGRTREPLFEPARECWREARAAGESMNARVTYGTDGRANGAVYAFADPPGGDLFAEFRDGRRPLEPLVARLAERADPPFEVVVLDPVEEPFVLVALARERDGVFARALRETYLGGGLAGRLAATRESDGPGGSPGEASDAPAGPDGPAADAARGGDVPGGDLGLDALSLDGGEDEGGGNGEDAGSPDGG